MGDDDPTGPHVEEAAGAVTPSPAPVRRSFLRRHWFAATLALLLAIPLLGMTLWAGIALNYTYSSGTRTGWVQKLSRKGWLCKTWEGELAMATAPGVPPQMFQFTIRDDSVAEALTRDMGRGRISLHYDEHRGVPTSCFGETPHYVQRFELVTNSGPPALP